MTGASFVMCPKCKRLMLGQVSGNGSIYPQPHRCTDEEGNPHE